MAFPRMMIWNITMDIPAGYSVLGLSSLNKLVRNEAGVFECAARTENNQVILNVKKQYSIKKVTAAQWAQVASMLDLAFNWSQLKIVLRKN
jgi:hypothetical protein